MPLGLCRRLPHEIGEIVEAWRLEMRPVLLECLVAVKRSLIRQPSIGKALLPDGGVLVDIDMGVEIHTEAVGQALRLLK
jgi:hypothetical protein